MEVVYQRCAGLDVHKETVVVCLEIREGGKLQKDIRTFRTMTSDLSAISKESNKKKTIITDIFKVFIILSFPSKSDSS